MPSTTSRDNLQVQITALVSQIRTGRNADTAKASLSELCAGPDAAAARELLEDAMKGELLETRWELEDVLEATAPKKAAPPNAEATPEAEAEAEAEPEPEPDPNAPLTSADMDLVYDDPRGLVLHKSKKGERWFATQVDPATQQPNTFELHPQEISQLRAQLQGSPYWMLGSGL